MQETQSKVRRYHWSTDTRADVLRAVVARFRPPNKAELASGGDQIVDFETEDTCNISVRKAPVFHI